MSVVDNDREERRELRRDEDLVPLLRESVWQARMRRIADADAARAYFIDAIAQAVDEDRGDDWLAADVTAIVAAWRAIWGQP